MTQANDYAPPAPSSDSWNSPKLQVDLWYKYEGVAMHFNDLLMRFRLQALGGLSVVGAVAGVASKNAIPELRASLPFIMTFLVCAWLALAILDRFYYWPLLRGAVEEVLKLESRVPELQMSTSIEASVKRAGGRCAADFFYCIIGGVLLVFAAVAWCAR